MNFDLNELELKERTMEKQDMKEILKLRNELKNYNMIDFLKNISALILFPENQSKSVIFQCMISTALSIPKGEMNINNNMSIGKFKQIVKRFSNLNRIQMVDPPEFPFVLPVMYYSNYRIYMGANSMSVSNLNIMLKVLMLNREKVEPNVYLKLNKMIRGLLTLSEQIYQKTKINFEKLESFNKDIDIYIPKAHVLHEYKQFIEFSKDYIESMFSGSIEEIICDFGDIKIQDIDDFNNQLFYDKPIIIAEKTYIMLDVTTIISLIMKKIIDYTIDNKNIDIIYEYNMYSKYMINNCFARMKNIEVDSKQFDLELIDNRNYSESLYSSGNDGIIIDILLFDNGNKFKEQKNYRMPLKNDFINNRIETIKAKLLAKNIDEYKITTIITPTTIGRNMYYPILREKMSNILILSLYELEAMSINEEKENMFLQRYLISRKKLKYYEKNNFSELNIVVFYSDKGYSFYIDDTIDIKETFLSLIGEYSADYILKAYIKEDKHLCTGIEKGTMLEVIKSDGNIYFSPELFVFKIMNQVYKINNFIIWCITDEIMDNELYGIYKFFIDLIMFWFNQMAALFNEKKAFYIIKVIINGKYEDFLEKKIVNSNIQDIMKYEKVDNVISIMLTPELLQYFDCNDNSREKELTKYLLKILNLYVNEEEINEIFINPYKKKTISIDTLDDAYMVPMKSHNEIRISRSDENLILDDIGLYLFKELKINYGKIKDDQILNKVVGKLYDELKKSLMVFNKELMLKCLYYEYENIISSLNIRQEYYANDIACYPEHEKDIKENYNELNKVSVALKFLIELESSLKNTGDKKTSQYDIEYMLAKASEIIEWAYIGDLVHYRMMESPIELLKSNRIGFDHHILNKTSIAMGNAREQKMSAIGKENIKKLEKFTPKAKQIEFKEFEQAFLSEFEYSLEEFKEVILYLLKYSEKDNRFLNNINEIDISYVIKELNDKISKENILKILDKLSLQEREDYLKPPKPYTKEDVYPWRFNRELSMTRKPLIINNGKIIYGYRTLSSSVMFLFNLINSCKFKAKSLDMKNYISKIEKIKGQDFNDKVFNYIFTNEEVILDKNVKKINGKWIVNNKNQTLGDIDILCIAENEGIINLIETKDFSLSRNFYEIYNEYLKMFDISNEKSFYNKHMKRVEWIKNNISDVISQYKLPNKNWKVTYLFVVDDYLISKDTFDVDIRISTLTDLNKHILLGK